MNKWVFHQTFKKQIYTDETSMVQAHKRRCKYNCEFHQYMQIYNNITNIFTDEILSTPPFNNEYFGLFQQR